MSSRKYIAAQNTTTLFLATVFVAQSCALQFFPIYLKYLNFSAIEVGVIRASQTWISTLLVPAFLFITKQLQSENWKRSIISVFLIINITLHLCLTFIPPSNMLQDVTHCHRQSSNPLTEEQVEPHHNKQWNIFKLIPQVYSHTANTTLKTPRIKIFHKSEVNTGNLSMPSTNGHTSLLSVVMKQDYLPRVLYHDIAKQVSDNSNITSHNHSKLSSTSSTEQNNVFFDSTKEMPKNISFFHNIRVMSSSTTEHPFLPVTESDVSLLTAIKHKVSVFVNGSRTESNKNTSTSTANETEFTQDPILKEIYYPSAQKIRKPITTNTSVHGESIGMENMENYTQTLTSQYQTEHANNDIKAMFTLLNRTLSKVHSQHNKLLLNKKLSDNRANTDEEQYDSTEQEPSSESVSEKIYHNSEVLPLKKETAIVHSSPSHKTWQNKSYTSQSEPWNAHLNQRLHYFKQESEDEYVPITSERNNTDDIRPHETWLLKHAGIPWAQHKYLNKYYAQGNGFRNASQETTDYSSTKNLEDIYTDEQSTNRLQPDIVVRMKGSRERPHNTENQTEQADLRLWGKYQHFFHHLKQYKSGRKIEKAGKKKNSLSITKKVKNLSAIRRVQKNMKQEKEFLPHEKQLRRKRVSRPATSESQEAEQFSTNISKTFTTKRSVHYTIKQCDKHKRDTKHKRHKASQPSPLANTLNYRETNKSLPTQAVDSSKSKHYDDDTDFDIDNFTMPWSNQNISMQLWKTITTDKLYDYWSTTFSTILLLSVLAEVFSRAITATSSQFLQCEENLRASEHKPITSQNCRHQVHTLLGWGLLGCPLLAALVLATECSYQPRVFLLFSASLFMLTLLVSLCLLQLPERKWDWKQEDYENKGKNCHNLSLQR